MKIKLLYAKKTKCSNKVPLVLFPPVMGGYFCYASLLEKICDRPVLAFDIDFDESKNSIKTLNDLSSEMLKLLLNEIKCGPFLFLGWSYGGLLAEQVARQIAYERKEDINLAPCYLIVVDTPPLSVVNKVSDEEFNENLNSITTILAHNGGIKHAVENSSFLSREDCIKNSFLTLIQNLFDADIPENKKNMLLDMSKISQKKYGILFKSYNRRFRLFIRYARDN